MLPIIKEKLALVPNLPGSYQMLDEFGTIIYVGKAKNLHRRVSSYFNREQTGKTKKLVNDIRDFTYIVATSETEAFLIEINLIKKYDPKYDAAGYTSDNYWAGAKKACEELGMSLPDKSKLESLYEAGKKDSSLGLPTSGWFWSSSEYNASTAYYVGFYYGDTSYLTKYFSINKVLCVGD